MEEHRKIKMKTLDENAKAGFLESTKKKVNFGEMKINIKFGEGSVVNGELTDVYKFINANF